MTLISSFNVNSINARKEIVINYLLENQIDILLIQETKCQNENFPLNEFNNIGYNVSFNGQKSYNGVAVISKFPIKVNSSNLFLNNDNNDEQARFLDVKILDYNLICLYVPNGNPINSDKYSYKIDWLNELYIYCKKLYNSNEKIILAGDFNIIQKDIDCYDPIAWQGDALFTNEVKSILKKIINIGFVDSYRAKNPNVREYSFWDYQNGAWQKDNGIRIDLILLSAESMDVLEQTGIHKTLRNKNRPSDHVPIWISLRD